MSVSASSRRLVFELSGSVPRGGPTSTLRVSQLIRLGQCTKACELFLRTGLQLCMRGIRQLRIEGATPLYIHKLCHVSLPASGDGQGSAGTDSGCWSAFVFKNVSHGMYLWMLSVSRCSTVRRASPRQPSASEWL